MTVINSYGVEINFDVAVSMMDDEIREQICGTVDTEQDFFDAYCEAHAKKFGEIFEPAKRNPCM